MRILLTVFCAAAHLASCCFSIADAQERTPNAGAKGALRAWAPAGKWQVLLVRLADGDLGCVMATGHLQPGERYIWGLRWRKEALGATISDNNQQAVSGPSIKVVIDKVPVGIFQITGRINVNGFENVAANFPLTEQKRIVDLFAVGAKVEFVTEAATYSSSLHGAQQALAQLKSCTVEATHLSSSNSK